MSSSSDEEIARKEFDPLKVLYGKVNTATKGPVCLFDNVASLVGYYKRSGENLEEKFDKTKRPQQQQKKVPLLSGEVVQRRFQPHQQMIQVGPYKKGKNERSVLTAMEKATGPMAQLRTWAQERTRVKVLIRKNHGIRGSATGVLRIFDKHWNLVLTDVEERYQRRKHRYANQVCASPAKEQQALQRLRELGIKPPMKDACIKSVRGKWVEITRKHDLLMVKGDQVAVVSKEIVTIK